MTTKVLTAKMVEDIRAMLRQHPDIGNDDVPVEEIVSAAARAASAAAPAASPAKAPQITNNANLMTVFNRLMRYLSPTAQDATGLKYDTLRTSVINMDATPSKPQMDAVLATYFDGARTCRQVDQKILRNVAAMIWGGQKKTSDVVRYALEQGKMTEDEVQSHRNAGVIDPRFYDGFVAAHDVQKNINYMKVACKFIKQHEDRAQTAEGGLVTQMVTQGRLQDIFHSLVLSSMGTCVIIAKSLILWIREEDVSFQDGQAWVQSFAEGLLKEAEQQPIGLFGHMILYCMSRDLLAAPFEWSSEVKTRLICQDIWEAIATADAQTPPLRKGRRPRAAPASCAAAASAPEADDDAPRKARRTTEASPRKSAPPRALPTCDDDDDE